MTDLFDEKKLLKKLPKKIENWKVKDVLVFLEMVELDDYEKVFEENEVNGSILLNHENNDIWSELQLKKSQRDFLKKCIEKLKKIYNKKIDNSSNEESNHSSSDDSPPPKKNKQKNLKKSESDHTDDSDQEKVQKKAKKNISSDSDHSDIDDNKKKAKGKKKQNLSDSDDDENSGKDKKKKRGKKNISEDDSEEDEKPKKKKPANRSITYSDEDSSPPKKKKNQKIIKISNNSSEVDQKTRKNSSDDEDSSKKKGNKKKPANNYSGSEDEDDDANQKKTNKKKTVLSSSEDSEKSNKKTPPKKRMNKSPLESDEDKPVPSKKKSLDISSSSDKPKPPTKKKSLDSSNSSNSPIKINPKKGRIGASEKDSKPIKKSNKANKISSGSDSEADHKPTIKKTISLSSNSQGSDKDAKLQKKNVMRKVDVVNTSEEEEDEKIRNQSKKVEERKVSAPHSSSDDEKTFKARPKNQKPQNIDDDEDNAEMTIIKPKNRKQVKEIIITSIKEKNQTEDFKFTNSFTINRDKKALQNIYINKREISRKHAEILLLENGFYMRDQGSTNHIYIKVITGSFIVLENFMEFRLGNSLIRIQEIYENKITLSIVENFSLDCENEDKVKECEIYLGKEVKFPNANQKKTFFKDDETIQIEQISFSKMKNNFGLKALFEADTWVKLDNAQDEDRNNKNFFYLLSQDIEIKMGEENHFLIKKTFKENFPICNKCKKPADSVNFPCLHITACFDCIKKIQKCNLCNESIKEKVKLVDIYKPAR